MKPDGFSLFDATGNDSAAENLKLFDVLCRYETVIRQHLAEVYIQLVLDAKQGVAYY